MLLDSDVHMDASWQADMLELKCSSLLECMPAIHQVSHHAAALPCDEELRLETDRLLYLP